MWFVPDNENQKIAGTLYYSPNDEIKLELIGTFHQGSLKDMLSEVNSKLHVIHGVVYGEKRLERITLFDCYASKRYYFSSGFPLTKYSCSLMLVGKLLSDSEERVFDKVCVNFPCLRDWYSYRPMEFSIQFDELGKKPKEFQWKMSVKDDRFRKCYKITEDTNLILDATCGFQQKNTSGYDLFEDSHIEIERNRKSSFGEFYSLAVLFKDFLSFAVLTEVSFSKIVLYDYDDFQEFESGEKLYHTITVYFVTPKIPPTRYKIEDFLFRFDKIEDTFHDIIKKWYEEKDKLAPIRTRLIDCLTHKKEFTSIDFLIIIQALQGFYYRYISKKKDTTLQEQLEYFFNKFADIPFVKKNPIDYKKVRDSRHYYSHFFGENEKKHICSGIELYKITQNLKLLLICNVLSLIGFDNEKINEFIRSSNKLVWACKVE